VTVQKRKTAWILFSFTYRYDVLQEEKLVLNIPQSEIMTVEDYKEMVQSLKGAESGEIGQ
jgi:hypothetical protein